MKANKLVEIAKQYKGGRKSSAITDDHIGLAIAWMKDEVSTTAVMVAINNGKPSGQMLYHLAMWMREGVRRGIIKL